MRIAFDNDRMTFQKVDDQGFFEANLMSIMQDTGCVGIGHIDPPQQLSLTGGIGFANANATDKKLYSPADGTLEWMTYDAAGEHGFAVSHQGEKRVYLNTNGVSYFMGGNVGIGTTNCPMKFVVEADNPLDGAAFGSSDGWVRLHPAT